MCAKVVIHWFRQDLRLHDNPSLVAAAEQGTVLPVYILDDANANEASMGQASRCWLHHSLQALQQSLHGKLLLAAGDPITILLKLVQQYAVQAVYWNRCYEPWRIKRDKAIKQQLQAAGIEVHSFNGSLLWEPWEIKKGDGTSYKVFTPFYRQACNIGLVREPLPKPRKLNLSHELAPGMTVADLTLLPRINWDQKVLSSWQVGERGANERLQVFLTQDLNGYKQGRDFPAAGNISRLSPHIHFGEISPGQIWYAAKQQPPSDDLEHFLRELCWREFSYHLLYYFPELPTKNLQAKFDSFAWRDDDAALQRWQQGQTGYPIIDAGMRELWQTGYMHNRVRMIVGSFLVKNLLLHWHHGYAWFWDCLFDADLANNSASWQWIAGCGADAAPYFRVFNPVTQGQKFDPQGDYTRCFVPELAQMPDKYLFNPWQAPVSVLQQAKVVLGKTYPEPIVDLAWSRKRALEVFAKLKSIGKK
jgi:deoxyribodipyrimidine photo-lyase